MNTATSKSSFTNYEANLYSWQLLISTSFNIEHSLCCYQQHLLIQNLSLV